MKRLFLTILRIGLVKYRLMFQLNVTYEGFIDLMNNESFE